MVKPMQKNLVSDFRSGLLIFLVMIFLQPLSVATVRGQSSAKKKEKGYPRVDTEKSTLTFAHDKYLLIKHKDKMFALKTIIDPRVGWHGIHYRWIEIHEDSYDSFIARLRKPKRDTKPSKKILTGKGFTKSLRKKAGSIKLNSIQLSWSRVGEKTGKIDLSKLDEEIEVYPRQFNDIVSIYKELDEDEWKSVKKSWTAKTESKAPEIDQQQSEVRSDAAVFRIQYDRYFLFKHNDRVIALMVTLDTKIGAQGINYYWYQLSGGSDDFVAEGPENGSAPNSKIKFGSGSASELRGDTAHIRFDGYQMEWSMCSLERGWVYFRSDRDQIQVCPKQFMLINDFSGKLDIEKWKAIK